MKLKQKYNLKIIEDNAQAIGAKWHGIHTGNLGDAAGFSFIQVKIWVRWVTVGLSLQMMRSWLIL